MDFGLLVLPLLAWIILCSLRCRHDLQLASDEQKTAVADAVPAINHPDLKSSTHEEHAELRSSATHEEHAELKSLATHEAAEVHTLEPLLTDRSSATLCESAASPSATWLLQKRDYHDQQAIHNLCRVQERLSTTRSAKTSPAKAGLSSRPGSSAGPHWAGSPRRAKVHGHELQWNARRPRRKEPRVGPGAYEPFEPLVKRRVLKEFSHVQSTSRMHVRRELSARSFRLDSSHAVPSPLDLHPHALDLVFGHLRRDDEQFTRPFDSGWGDSRALPARARGSRYDVGSLVVSEAAQIARATNEEERCESALLHRMSSQQAARFPRSSLGS